ncbi:MAG: hypothetical protein U9R53_02785 [Chloroflexota bacterium]|nr:hypothetical protein [Chloroflexota bacterium]
MSHQPFETWLLSGESLNPQQEQALDAHLQTCKECQKLSIALYQVSVVLETSPEPTPQPGFSQRWHKRLSVHRHQQQQRRMWFMTLGLFSIAGFILSALLILNHQAINWVYELSQFIANFSLAAARVIQLWSILQSITKTLPILIPMMILLGVGLFSATTVLIITWFRSLIRLYKPLEEGVSVR